MSENGWRKKRDMYILYKYGLSETDCTVVSIILQEAKNYCWNPLIPKIFRPEGNTGTKGLTFGRVKYNVNQGAISEMGKTTDHNLDANHIHKPNANE